MGRVFLGWAGLGARNRLAAMSCLASPRPSTCPADPGRSLNAPSSRPGLLMLALLLALAVPRAVGAAAAAAECTFRVEGASPEQPRRLRVGEISRSRLGPRVRIVNDGPHDVRISFDGLAPRLLAAGQAEPANGRLPPPVVVTAIECLPSRAGSWRNVPAGTGAARAGPALARSAASTPHPPGATP